MEHYYGHRQRLKDKFTENQDALADYEILELILGFVIARKDVKPIAKEILRKYGSIAGIFGNKISEIDGVGPQTELFFNLLGEFFSRIQVKKIKSKPHIKGPKDIYEYMRYLIGYSSHEIVVAVFLNAKNCITGHKTIAEGTVNSTAIFPRTIAEFAVHSNAAGVILVHNHPSGDSTPSQADIDMTRVIEQALDLLNIKLIDHVVICAGEFSSLKDLNLF